MVGMINTPPKNFVDAPMASRMLRVSEQTQIDQTVIRRVVINVMDDEAVYIDSR